MTKKPTGMVKNEAMKSEALISFINKNFLIGTDKKTVEPNENLLLSGLIDSLGVMQLVAHIQAETGIKIEPRDITLKNFKTVNAILGFIKTKENA